MNAQRLLSRSLTRIYSASTVIPSRRALHVSAQSLQYYQNATGEEFKKRVVDGDEVHKPILVDFYANWCAPCKMLSPLLEEVTGNPSLTNNKEIDLMTVDCDEQVDLAREFEVSALPTVIAFVDGQPVGKFMGAVPRSQLIEFCNELTKRYA